MSPETRYIIAVVQLCFSLAVIIGVWITAAVIWVRNRKKSMVTSFLACMLPALGFATQSVGLAYMGIHWAKQDIAYAQQAKLTTKR